MIIFPPFFSIFAGLSFASEAEAPSRKTSKTRQEDIIFPSKSLGVLCFFRTFIRRHAK